MPTTSMPPVVLRTRSTAASMESLPAIERDLVVALSEQGAIGHGTTDEMQRLTQGAAGVLLVQLWPQQRQQRVAAVKAAGSGDCEVGEEGRPLRGRKDDPKLAPLGIAEVQPPQRPKFDHDAALRPFNASSFGGVTPM